MRQIHKQSAVSSEMPPPLKTQFSDMLRSYLNHKGYSAVAQSNVLIDEDSLVLLDDVAKKLKSPS